MQTQSYSSLFDYVSALCGVTFATSEAVRIKAHINRRANEAYRKSLYWPRFLVVGEERTVTSGIIAFEESGLDSIDTFMRIHRTTPFQSQSAQEFDFFTTGSGADIVSGDLDVTSAFVTYKKQMGSRYGDAEGENSLIPDEWFYFIGHGAYADFLRSEGQQEKAVLADQEANLILEEELMRVSEQDSSNIFMKISTNANRQTR